MDPVIKPSTSASAGDRRTVVLADPSSSRRQRLARRTRQHRVIEAATLQEVYPLAEELGPDVLALASDFLAEPEVEGILRLARMLDATVFAYADTGQSILRTPIRERLTCIAVQPADGVDDLLARLSDPEAQIAATTGDAALPELILIGASTGGITATEAVLSTFPADCPPTLVVQHIRDGYVAGLVRRLDLVCLPRVVEATQGLPLTRGMIAFAADESRHLTLAGTTRPRCALVATPPRQGHRPAVDPLFESAVPWAPQVAAALLTGMGSDGAAGMGALRAAGAFTIAQDQATSVVWGMPRAAAESGAAAVVLPLPQIGPALLAGARSQGTIRGRAR